MVNYLDSRRIMGTTSERSSIPSPATQGGWVELGRTTLNGTSNNINVSSLDDKRYYMVLYDIRDTTGINPYLRLNSDTGTNYSFRYTGNGSADIPSTNYSIGMPISAATTDQFCVGYYANYSTKEKLAIQHAVTKAGTGAGTAPGRAENVGKHAQTSNPISSFNLHDPATAGFASGSEVVVLGWDPDDTHTTNFWEELASADLSGGLIDTGVFTSKKYLWIQGWCRTGSVTNGFVTCYCGNSTIDKGTSYSLRSSINGSTDGTATSQSTNGMYRLVGQGGSNSNENTFFNIFVINNSANEKLFIGHNNWGTNGAGTAPNRSEAVAKWINTSNQINRFSVEYVGSGSLSDGTVKIWGAD